MCIYTFKWNFPLHLKLNFIFSEEEKKIVKTKLVFVVCWIPKKYRLCHMWDFSIRTRPHTCEHSNGLRWVGCQKSSFISKGSVAIGVWQPFSGPNTKTLRCDQTHCFAKYGKILRHTNIGSSDWGDIILATNNHWSFSNTFIIQWVPCSQVELDL